MEPESTPNVRPARRAGRRRRRAIAAALLVTTALAAGVVFLRPLFSGNFGVVDPGRVYRCAQPEANLAQILDASRPASILNLRGGSAADLWYAGELHATRRLGIDFYDIPLSPVRRPTRRELRILIDVLQRCRYPLLIHCKSGSDRTGLVSALYLMLHRGEPPERALRSFSLVHGHVPIGGPEHLHEPFLEYAAWLKARGLSHSPDRLRAWVLHDYLATDPPGDLPPLRPGPRHQAHAARPEVVQ